MVATAEALDATGLFYFAATQEENRSFRRMNVAEKLKLMREKKWQGKLHFELLKEYLPSGDLHIESYADLFHFLSKLPLNRCFQPQVPLDTYFPCLFVRGNYAWISVKDNHYRYYTKRKGKKVIGLDLLDLVEVSYQLSPIEAIRKVSELLSIPIVDNRWKKEQREKYFRNYQWLSSCSSRIDPHLFLYVCEGLPVLEALNGLGALYVHKERFSYKGQNIFFASNYHLARYIEGFSPSKVNKLVNLFAVLGFVEKVPIEFIHPALMEKTAKIRNRRNLANTIGFYIVYPFEQVSDIAAKRAEILLKEGIRYSNLSKALIEDVFGEGFAQAVYVQEIQKNKHNPQKKAAFLYEVFEHRFQSLLEQNGYVTKSMILQEPIEGFQETQCKNHLNQYWSHLLSKHNCRYQKPTKEMKEQLSLPTMEYIAFKKNNEKRRDAVE